VEAITVKEFCERYLADCEAGLVLGQRPQAEEALHQIRVTDELHTLGHSISPAGRRQRTRKHSLPPVPVLPTHTKVLAPMLRLG
jgi:hypothetical protein